jgi:hypothetical protein
MCDTLSCLFLLSLMIMSACSESDKIRPPCVKIRCPDLSYLPKDRSVWLTRLSSMAPATGEYWFDISNSVSETYYHLCIWHWSRTHTSTIVLFLVSTHVCNDATQQHAHILVAAGRYTYITPQLVLLSQFTISDIFIFSILRVLIRDSSTFQAPCHQLQTLCFELRSLSEPIPFPPTPTFFSFPIGWEFYLCASLFLHARIHALFVCNPHPTSLTGLRFLWILSWVLSPEDTMEPGWGDRPVRDMIIPF